MSGFDRDSKILITGGLSVLDSGRGRSVDFSGSIAKTGGNTRLKARGSRIWCRKAAVCFSQASRETARLGSGSDWFETRLTEISPAEPESTD